MCCTKRDNFWCYLEMTTLNAHIKSKCMFCRKKLKTSWSDAYKAIWLWPCMVFSPPKASTETHPPPPPCTCPHVFTHSLIMGSLSWCHDGKFPTLNIINSYRRVNKCCKHTLSYGNDTVTVFVFMGNSHQQSSCQNVNFRMFFLNADRKESQT